MNSIRQEILEALDAKIIDVETAVLLLEHSASTRASSEHATLRSPAPHTCSICGGAMYVKKLECEACHSTIEGTFLPCAFNRLTAEEHQLLLLFLTCRGNVKELERELRVSYPTVRNRVEHMLNKIVKPKTPEASTREQILEGVSTGYYSVREALAWFVSEYYRNKA